MPTFGSRLFGSSPLSAPGGLVPAPPPGDLPADLAGAVAARFATDPTLSAMAVPVFNGQASDGAALPHAVFSEVSVRPHFNTGGAGYYEHHYLRLSCFAATAQRAREVGDAAVRALNLKPMAIASGYVMAFRWAGGHTVAEARRGAGNHRVFNRTLTFKATVGRSM